MPSALALVLHLIRGETWRPARSLERGGEASLDVATKPGGEADLAFLAFGGECGALIRNHDWAASPLGPPAAWPQALKTALSLMLGGAQPAYIAWGDDLLSFYNDGYLPIVGDKHSGIGLPFRHLWREIWAEFEPIVAETLAGRSQYFVDLPIALAGRPGVPLGYFTFSYTALRDDQGVIRGFYCAATETTERVAAEATSKANEARLGFFEELAQATRASSDASEIMAITARLLGEQLDASVCAYADMDLDEDHFTIRGDWAAPGSSSIVGSYRLTGFGATAFGELRAGRPFVAHDTLAEVGPEEAALFLEIGLKATVCMPLVKAGRLTALMAVHQAEPRHWSDADLALIRDTTERSWAHIERVRSEAALRDSEERLRLAADAARIGTWDIDLRRGLGRWDELAVRIAGFEGSEGRHTSDDWLDAIHAEDRDRVRAAFEASLQPGGPPYEVEFRGSSPAVDGGVRWLASHGAVLRDAAGRAVRAVGILQDVTERLRAEHHQQLLIDELNHRSKNLLAIIQSIAQQSFRGPGSPTDMRAAFEGRLGALGAAHGILTRLRWEAAPIGQIIADTIAAIRPDDGRVHLDGPPLAIAPKTGVSLAMAIHELTTNAIKYGSLSNAEGRVDAEWSRAGGRFALTWRESGGPPVSPPASRGFGTRMIERGLAAELGGTVTIAFDPDGLLCTVEAPLPASAA